MIKSEKGQVGTTLTWMVAFIIIFVIMALFIIFTGILVSQKEVSSRIPIIGLSKSKIDILTASDSIETQRKLFYLLDAPLKADNTIKKLIFDWKMTGDSETKEKIVTNVKNILEKEKDNCYLFKIDNVVFYSNIGKISKYENLVRASLFLDNKKINLEFYSKEC